MKKRPIYLSLAMCLLTLSLMITYFTMYSNVQGLDNFLNWDLQFGGNTAETATPDKGGTATPSVTNTPVVTPEATQTPEATPESTEPPAPAYTDISLAFAGDFLIHDNVLKAHYDDASKTYNFDAAFSAISTELSKADLVAASLEVPFGGTEAGDYAGYPRFNCPDALAASFAKNKISMLFTAGVHAFDAGTAGMERTLTTLTENGLVGTGTRLSAENQNYAIAVVQDVKVGFINYTVGDRRSDGKIHANGTTLSQEQEDCINVFTYDALEGFYAKLETELAAMKAAGAEVLVVGIRWGTDYTTTVDANQKAIAQKLCDMGVDIIAGNGPHVVQPFEALTSQTTGNTTLCMYSLGNFLSNQRRELVSDNSGRTEDGIIYKINIRKQADGTVTLGTVEYVPTWVSLTEDADGTLTYSIVPVTAQSEGSKESESYERTQDVVAEGVEKHNNGLAAIDDEEE